MNCHSNPLFKFVKHFPMRQMELPKHSHPKRTAKLHREMSACNSFRQKK